MIDIKVQIYSDYYQYYKNKLTLDVIDKEYNMNCEETDDNRRILITNKVKFGMNESQIVQDLVNCLQAFSEQEVLYRKSYKAGSQI